MATNEHDDAPPVYRDGEAVYYPDNSMPVVRAARAKRLNMTALARGHYAGRRIPEGVLPGLKTIGCIHAVLDKQLLTGEHRNEGFEIHFVECGRIGFRDDGREYCLQPGDLIYTDPWQPHSLGYLPISGFRVYWMVIDVGVRAPGEDWQWPPWILLTEHDRREFRRRLRNTNQPVWRAPELKSYFQRIGMLVAAESPRRHAAQLGVLINQVLVTLLDTLRGQTPDDAADPGLAIVEQFWHALRDDSRRLAQEWTLPQLAAECGLGLTQFTHFTRELFNQPPIHYLRDCRLELAGWLLQDDRNRRVTEIALACGFSDSAQFSKSFRQHFGCPPQVYRARGQQACRPEK
ncbi:MAG: AraC family transcriptional regulator [Thermoguttaceae bacterium]|jgi:AraC family L-rhamnose operon regulatory protein RhaS